MKKIFFLLIIGLLMIFGVSALITTVYNDEIKSGEQVNLRVSLYNKGTNIKNAKVHAYIPYLGVYDRSSTFKLRSKTSSTTYLDLYIPEGVRGYYPIIFTVQNDEGIREKSHSWIYIS